MRLQYHVISQKMAKALADAKLPQKARLYWVNDLLISGDSIVPGFTQNVYAAFDGSELGWLMPRRFVFEMEIWETGAIVRLTGKDSVQEFQAQTEVGARARALLYLIENGLYSANEAVNTLFKREGNS